MNTYKVVNQLLVVLFIILLFCSCSNSSKQKKSCCEKNKTGCESAVKVGAWYFGGWSYPGKGDGYDLHITPSLVSKFSEREPVWGWREDQSGVMEKQIDYAANSGLSFWGFCWYENCLTPSPEFEVKENLNNALRSFLQSSNKDRLDFCLLSCFAVTPDNWDTIIDKTISLFKEPNYLKVDGKPVMTFFNTDQVIKGLGGIEGMTSSLKLYREKARESGIGEILVGARTGPKPTNPDYQKKYEESGFDFLLTYHNAPGGRVNEGANDFDHLRAGGLKTWNDISMNTSLPFIPTVGTGFDSRPWEMDYPTIKYPDYWFTGTTPEKIGAHLRDGIHWIKENPNKALGNLLFMYAWNENGEGAWLTPTKSEGNARLEAVQKVINEEIKK